MQELPEACCMAEFRVKHQEQVVRMCPVATPGLGFLELFSVRRDQSTHCVHPRQCLTAGYRCHLTLFQGFTNRKFPASVCTGCLPLLLSVDLQRNVHILNMVQ